MAVRVLILGGQTVKYHQFIIMGPIMQAHLTQAGINVTLSEDLDELLPKNINKYDVVVNYTTGRDLTPEQWDGLRTFVAGGRGFVGVHGAADSFKGTAPYLDMVGGRFVSHPPQATWHVEILSNDHPITHGLAPFDIWDELYYLDYCSEFQPLLRVMHEGVERYVGWVKPYGQGRVFYLALGHGPEAHQHPVFQQLLLRGIHWANGREELAHVG